MNYGNEPPSWNIRAAAEAACGQTPTRTLDVVPLSEVPPESVEWLWRARIPMGKTTLLVGDPGGGKSYATLAIAAGITNGTPLPDDDEEKTPRRVLMWNGEDGLEDTIRPRAAKAGVRLEHLHVIRGIRDEEDKPRPFGLADLHLVAQTVEELGDVAMVVIDPIASLLAGTDSHRDTEVRSALQPLADLARLHRLAVLVVMHLRKAEAERAIYRVGGSIGFVGMARSVLLAGVDPESGRRAIIPLKSSLCADALPIEYRIDEEGHWWWNGIAEELSADHLLRAPAHRRPRASLDDAKAYLEETLLGGPRPSAEVAAEIKERGISNSTFHRARKELGIHSHRVGGAAGEGAWSLSLPAKTINAPNIVNTMEDENLSRKIDIARDSAKIPISSVLESLSHNEWGAALE
jgi:hypothetical protein